MKTLIPAAALLLALSSTANAQTEKGRWTAGVQVGSFTYQNSNGNKTFRGNLTPLAGYFVTNGLAVGLGVPVSYVTRSSNFSNSSSTSVGGSPFVTYFIGSAKLKPFVGFSYGYNRTTLRSNSAAFGNSRQKLNSRSNSYVPSIGLAYFLNRNVALSLSANYFISRLKQTSTITDASGIRTNSSTTDDKDLSLGIGFQLFFGK